MYSYPSTLVSSFEHPNPADNFPDPTSTSRSETKILQSIENSTSEAENASKELSQDKFEYVLARIKSSGMFHILNCISTSRALQRLMAGDSTVIKSTEFHKADLEATSENNIILQSVLTIPNQPEHIIYDIAIYPDLHEFIVEKETTSEGTYWRVYQSWEGNFTLRQWLGIDLWPEQKSDDQLSSKDRIFYNFLNDSYDNYGKGKKLSYPQIESFMKSILDFAAKHKRVQWYCKNNIGYVKEYNVDSSLYLNEPISSEKNMEYEQPHQFTSYTGSDEVQVVVPALAQEIPKNLESEEEIIPENQSELLLHIKETPFINVTFSQEDQEKTQLIEEDTAENKLRLLQQKFEAIFNFPINHARYKSSLFFTNISKFSMDQLNDIADLKRQFINILTSLSPEKRKDPKIQELVLAKQGHNAPHLIDFHYSQYKIARICDTNSRVIVDSLVTPPETKLLKTMGMLS